MADVVISTQNAIDSGQMPLGALSLYPLLLTSIGTLPVLNHSGPDSAAASRSNVKVSPSREVVHQSSVGIGTHGEKKKDAPSTAVGEKISAYCHAMGGNRPIRSILIANNGIAAVKCIRSIRSKPSLKPFLLRPV